jgi:regulatory protein YycI of two-component signal transduction system YycFG
MPSLGLQTADLYIFPLFLSSLFLALLFVAWRLVNRDRTLLMSTFNQQMLAHVLIVAGLESKPETAWVRREEASKS